MRSDDSFKHSEFIFCLFILTFLHVARFTIIVKFSAYNLERLRLPMSEAAFGSNFTNLMTKGILTFDQIYHYEE